LSLLTTAANLGISIYYFTVPPAPAPALTLKSKDLVKDREFKKAVESIANGQGFLGESDVETLIEQCRVLVGGKISCN
jgi:hypothetical protein